MAQNPASEQLIRNKMTMSVKSLLTKLLPEAIIGWLQRVRFERQFSKPYQPVELQLQEVCGRESGSSYASVAQKESPHYRKIMRKLESYTGAGPVGPNKYWEYPWVLESLDLEPGLRILDAGCGRAPVQFVLADLGMTVHGIDPSEGVPWHGIERRLSKKFGLEIDYRVEGMESISFADEFFDRVTSVSVLEHCRAYPTDNEWAVPQDQRDRALHAKMMQEMTRVLKPGGLLVLTLDVVFPERDCILDANIHVRNLIDACPNLELLGEISHAVYPDQGFSMARLQSDADVDIQDYQGILGTSLGLVFRKTPR